MKKVYRLNGVSYAVALLHQALRLKAAVTNQSLSQLVNEVIRALG